MATIARNDFQLIQSTLSTHEVRDRLAETEKMMDAYLARITRLQMLINLEEARFLQAQEEYQQLGLLVAGAKACEQF